MTEKEGVLRKQPTGRWAVCQPGRSPVEITSGEVIRVEVDGEFQPTRVEYRHFAPNTNISPRGESITL